MSKIAVTVTLILGLVLGSKAQVIKQDQIDYATTKSGLKYFISNVGQGDFAKPGDKVWVHYYGKLLNDSVFENTLETGVKDFYLGQGQLIKAWEEGLQLLQAGGSIVMEVKPELGYGNSVYKGVKPNTTMIFEITLVQIDKGNKITPFNIEGIKAESTTEGLTYYKVKRGEGKIAQEGDNAYVHYTGYLSNGSIFTSSLKKGKTTRITVGTGHVFEGWDQGLQLMQEGSKYRFVIPPELAYGKKGFKNIVPPNDTITLDVELVNLTPEIKVNTWDAEDRDTIETVSGLRYIIFEPGAIDTIEKENIVEVHYSGYFANKELFDSSVKREEPIKFPVGVGVVIDGWDEGLLLMKKGAKFQFLVPAKLAYGDQGAPPQIPANADLIFDIEVLDVIK